jgi:mono/diheme cytochrome c family protein
MDHPRRGRAVRLLALVPTALLWLLADVARAQSAAEGQGIFTGKCAACHTIGRGKLVGPDLAGVTARRQADWLFRQIKEPQALIAEKDPIVMGLLQETNNIQMVPLGLSDIEIRSVIEYLKSTEGQGVVAGSVPAEFVPTVLVSLVLLAAFTIVGFKAGARKEALALHQGVAR